MCIRDSNKNEIYMKLNCCWNPLGTRENQSPRWDLNQQLSVVYSDALTTELLETLWWARVKCGSLIIIIKGAIIIIVIIDETALGVLFEKKSTVWSHVLLLDLSHNFLRIISWFYSWASRQSFFFWLTATIRWRGQYNGKWLIGLVYVSNYWQL